MLPTAGTLQSLFSTTTSSDGVVVPSVVVVSVAFDRQSGEGISVRGAMVQYQKNNIMNNGTTIHTWEGMEYIR